MSDASFEILNVWMTEKGSRAPICCGRRHQISSRLSFMAYELIPCECGSWWLWVNGEREIMRGAFMQDFLINIRAAGWHKGQRLE